MAPALALQADSLDLKPAADTTLHELNPTYNMGGEQYFSVGTTERSTRARALLKFDLTQLPSGATITNASLTLTLPALNRIDTTAIDYDFSRLLRDWGEGVKTGNTGSPATAGEATWNSSATPALWTQPGASSGSDFDSEPAFHALLGPAPGRFTIPSSFRLELDAQFWFDHPEQNFGWLIKAVDESVPQSAKRFASRESASGVVLHLDFSVTPPLRFTTAGKADGVIQLEWTGGKPPYQIEGSTNLSSTNWFPLTTALEGTNATFGITPENRYFRLRELF
jgi:hypothetical protein